MLKPTYVTVTVAVVDFVLRVKLPSTSVTVTFFVPFWDTVAPIIGSPFESTTFPESFSDFACWVASADLLPPPPQGLLPQVWSERLMSKEPQARLCQYSSCDCL